MQTTIHTEKRVPICYPYLTGFLEQRLSVIAQELVTKELADKMAVWAIQAYINSIIEEAHEAERKYTLG